MSGVTSCLIPVLQHIQQQCLCESGDTVSVCITAALMTISWCLFYNLFPQPFWEIWIWRERQTGGRKQRKVHLILQSSPAGNYRFLWLCNQSTLLGAAQPKPRVPKWWLSASFSSFSSFSALSPPPPLSSPPCWEQKAFRCHLSCLLILNLNKSLYCAVSDFSCWFFSRLHLHPGRHLRACPVKHVLPVASNLESNALMHVHLHTV